MDSVILTLFLIVIIAGYVGIYIISSKYSKVNNSKKITGLDATRKILDKNNLKHIIVIETKSKIGDSFDLDRGVIKLTSDVYYGKSITALGIATFIAYQFVWESENKESYILKSKIDNFLKYVIIGCYIMLLIGLMINDNVFINISLSLLLVILFYHICVLSYRLNLYNYVKEKSAKTNKKDLDLNIIFSMMIFIDFKIYVTIIVEGFKKFFDLLKPKK